MRVQQPVGKRRLQPQGGEGGDRGDEAVDQHRQPVLRGGQIRAGQRRQFEAAELAQRGERIARAGTRQRRLDRRELAPQPVGIDAGAGADQRGGRLVEQRRGQRRARCGVADAHLAADIELRAGGVGARDRFGAGGERAPELFIRHRRLAREVARAGGDAPVEHAGQRAGRDDGAEIDDFECGAVQAREHCDRRATVREVAQHLGRDRLRIG